MHAAITIPDELQSQIEAEALAEGKTVNELTVELLQRHLARRSLERLKPQGDFRHRGLSEEQVQSIVDRAITEVRRG